jgi:hypothetical protein
MIPRILRRAFFATVVFVSFAASVSAAPFVYVVTGSQQFGLVDLANGRFHTIGNPTPDTMSNLVWEDGDLYSLTASGSDVGSLAKINTRTGEVTDVGPTGLGFNAFSLAEVRGKLYLTDFSNNLYTVNRETGEATPVSATGMPPDPNVPFTFNNDGTFNLCDEGFYGIGGELYATFDSFAIDPAKTPPTIAHVFVSPALYRINPHTGTASYVAETDLKLTSLVDVDGKAYAFEGVLDGFDQTYNFPVAHSELMRLDLANGKTVKLTDIDPSIGPIFGAAPIRGRR